MNSKIAVVVLSCDKYKDLWPPFFELLFKNWPDCPYDVLLFANEVSYDDRRVKTILSGPDKDWSSSVKACLKQIDYEYLLILFDDVFLIKKVDQERLNKLVGYIEQYKPDYQKFTPVPKPDERINKEIGKYLPTTHYRNGLMSIWKRDILIEMLQEGESAWAFEIKGLERSKKYENFFGSYDEYFHFLHGVEKGMWYRKAAKELQSMGVKIDLEARKVLANENYLRSQLSLLRRSIFINTPVQLRPYLFKTSEFVRNKIYKKW